LETGQPTPTQGDYAKMAQAQKENESPDSHDQSDKKLKELVPNNEMYSAMENFLLGDPERQIPMLDVDRLIEEGNVAKNAGQSIMARTKYETAAKVELYKRKKESLQELLQLAQEVTDESDNHSRLQRELLENIDSALDVAKKYYDSVPGALEG
jgi:hypothetical protein